MVDVFYLVAGNDGQSRDWLLPAILVAVSTAAISAAAALQLRDRWHDRQAKKLRAARRAFGYQLEHSKLATNQEESVDDQALLQEQANELAKSLAETNLQLQKHHEALRRVEDHPKLREWMFFGLGVIASIGVSLVFWLLGPPP